MGKQLDKALALHRAGDIEAAAQLYEGLFRRDSRDGQAAFLLGVARLALRQDRAAIAPLERAVRLQPRHVEARRALGEAYDRTGQLNLAIATYEAAVALAPNDPRLALNLSALHLSCHDGAAALKAAEAASRLDPPLADARLNVALALKLLGRSDEAVAVLEAAAALAPNEVKLAFTLGNLLLQRGQNEAAAPWLRRALALAPRFLEAKLALAHILRENGQTAEAMALVDEVLADSPDHPVAQVWRVMLRLPVVYRDRAEIEQVRESYGVELARLAQRVAASAPSDQMEPSGRQDIAPLHYAGANPHRRTGVHFGGICSNPAHFLPGIASSRPFLLAYQGRDDRALQEVYGALVSTIVGASVTTPPLRRIARARHRIGIVSGYFRHHSVWKIPTRGWYELDRERFEIVCYHTSAESDSETAVGAARADRFVQGPKNLADWVELLAADACDVLLYPEIGMDPMAVQLAALRLAPVQCNGLGHPVTSGLATMDYALSSALMEPDDAAAHYSERLVTLPNLGVAYDYLARPTEEAARAALGLAPGDMAFWCGQSLFKYQPDFDWTFASIAARVPAARFVFIGFQGGSGVTDLFTARLAQAFAAQGLDWRTHLRLLPRLSSAGFVAAAGQCDAILDSIGWAGFNSTLESFAHDLPLVTMAGPFMRGRHGAAILRRLGLDDAIATTPEAFVARAVRLAEDETFRAACRAEIATRKSVLFDDNEPIAALGTFLDAAIRSAAAADNRAIS